MNRFHYLLEIVVVIPLFPNAQLLKYLGKGLVEQVVVTFCVLMADNQNRIRTAGPQPAFVWGGGQGPENLNFSQQEAVKKKRTLRKLH